MIVAAVLWRILFSAGPAPATAQDYAPIARVLPPKGVDVPPDTRAELAKDEAALAARMKQAAANPQVADIVPDIEIYEKAIRFALADDEFYSAKDLAAANALIAEANQRLDELARGAPSWTTRHGQFVRGFRSAIDGSAQPYGLDIPEELDLSRPAPLYVWLHGRGDKETDLHFIRGRTGHKGQIGPAGAIVLHPFGRQCLGFKSAGEIDVLEAIASVESRYKIDPDRVVLMGFSMGGAGAWLVGSHFTDEFCAVHAGAGFVDVAQYQHLKPENYPAWYEQKLWGLNDVPDYARNLFNLTTVAYGGEIDPQRASSQIMADVFAAQGHHLVRIVGPKMPHKYDPASLADIMRRMAAAVADGRNRYPRDLTFQTRTLAYNHMDWVTVTGLDEHWIDSRVDAHMEGKTATLITKNISRLALQSPTKEGFDGGTFIIDGDRISIHTLPPGLKVEIARVGGRWRIADREPATLRKQHGLQGPIDDIFTRPFLVVTPTGPFTHPLVKTWVDFELSNFESRWRDTFRGELRIKRDVDVTPDDISRYHLVLWGDASSNTLIARAASALPVKWSATDLSIGTRKFDAGSHVPLLIYPSPLSPGHYVVLNSGPTFRQGSDHTNSLQNPKLPDWAIVDLTTPPDASAPGKVEDAGFFDEAWSVKKEP